MRRLSSINEGTTDLSYNVCSKKQIIRNPFFKHIHKKKNPYKNQPTMLGRWVNVNVRLSIGKVFL